jgi:spermidine synthase
MRELIVVFNGNEISLGIMLASWLLWTAAGSGLAGRLALGTNDPRRVVAALECLLGISLLPTIWAVRASRAFFQTVPGELVGPVPMLLTSLACLSAFCILSGGLFVVATRMYKQASQASDRIASSSAYLLESAGSALGGILASLVLLRYLEAFQIAAVVVLLNLCMAAILLFSTRRRQVVASALVVTFLAIPLLLYIVPSLRASSQARMWRGFRLVDSRDSIYGNLAVVQTGTLRSVYDNGVILATAPDEASAEEAVHYALLEHPAPKKVLLIGGGINGSIAQALQHSTVERVDYAELDPMLIDVAREFFPVETTSLSADPRVHIHYADGRRYLRTARDTFDVIILDLPGPQTAQLNRFYTAEFFRSAGDHLAPGGLLALQLPSSEEHISPQLGEFLRCIHHTLRQVFPFVAVIPGETIHFFAAQQADVLADHPETLIARLQTRKIQTQYVREYFIPYRMMPDRMEQIHRLLQPLPATPVNRDFEPIAYYFDVVLWSAQFKLGYSHWFQAAARVGFIRIMDSVLITLLLAALFLAYVPARERRARASAAGCVAAMGFTLMALQIFLLFAFQSVYGYVYHQLAILIALFMAGIAFGSWLGIRRMRSADRPPFRVITVTQFLLVLSGPALIFLVSELAQISGRAATLLAAQLAFPALAALCGTLGGFQFPVATEIYLRGSSTQRGLGVLYAIDLLGGCIGALLLSSYLIPVFGFWKTAWLSAAVNLAPALLAARVALESRAARA